MDRLKPALRTFSDAAKAVDVVTETDVGIAWAFVVAVSGAAVFRAESPRATAQDFVLAILWPARVLARRLFVIVDLIEVVTPCPDVADDVVESPSIWLLLADGSRMSS